MSHVIEVNFRPKRVVGVLISCQCQECRDLKAVMAAAGMATSVEELPGHFRPTDKPKGAA